MSLLKRHTGRRRHVGRRVAGVAVGVALLVLGLEAPAYAQTTVTGFSPASGPPGCVVVITGTNFNNPTVTAVDFDGAAAQFALVSGTTIWAEVPVGATNGPINVTNSLETVSSPTGFTVTGGAGDCAPTIASFTPVCGPAGTDVTITGTNLLQGVDEPSDTGVGGNVRFAPYAANATPTAAAASPTEISANVPVGAQDGPVQVRIPGVANVNSTGTFDAGTCITEFAPTSGDVGTTVTITGVGFQGATAVTFAGAGATRVQAIFQITSDTETTDTITATVPVGAITGTIQVVRPGDTATSASDFMVGPDGGGVDHQRSITLRLRRHRARGVVGSTEDPAFTDCVAAVPVQIQRRRAGGGWRTVRSVTTNDSGAYRGSIPHRAGRYRARAVPVSLGDPVTDDCLRATSPVRRHRH